MIQIAHRGYSNSCKDNSKDAFLKAVAKNFDMIELDIQLSRDDKIFIYHDTTIQSFLLKNLSLDEIKKVDPDILSLREFFDIVDTTKIKIYLDVKGNNIDICSILYIFLKNKNLHNIFIASFNIDIIHELNKMNSKYQLGIITDNIIPIPLLKEYIDFCSPTFFSLHWQAMTEETLHFLHKQDIIVYTFTCKNENIFSFIKDYNVDGIVTDYKIQL